MATHFHQGTRTWVVCTRTSIRSRSKVIPFVQGHSCPAPRREPCACRMRRCSRTASDMRQLWCGFHHEHAAAAARAQHSWSLPDVSARLRITSHPHTFGKRLKAEAYKTEKKQDVTQTTGITLRTASVDHWNVYRILCSSVLFSFTCSF